MYGVMCGLIFRHIICAKLGLYFSSDVYTAFGSGVGGEFEVVVEDEVVSENESTVNDDSNYEVDLDIGDISGWGELWIDYSKEVEP